MEKRLYSQPSVESMCVLFGSMVMNVSPNGVPVGDPVPNEGGD